MDDEELTVGQFVTLAGDVVCPACATAQTAHVQCPQFYLGHDAPLHTRVGEELVPFEVVEVVMGFTDAHPEAGDLDRGRALAMQWCSGCEAYRWVIITLDTVGKRAQLVGMEMVGPRAEVLDTIDWLGPDIAKQVTP